GDEPAGGLIENALRRGIDVVSANKGLIVTRGAEFRTLAERSGARFLYSASVCGALPVLEVVRTIAGEKRIVAIEGILNSTTNFILDLLARGQTFEQSMTRARRQGFCESDPREDLDGTDAAHKLTLVAREAFGANFHGHWVLREGIENLDPAYVRAESLAGRSVRLVATCRRVNDRLELSLSPRRLDSDHALARTVAEQNAVTIHTEDGVHIVLRGKGAGRWPTTQSVVGDLLELSRLRQATSITSIPALERAAAG
ncbi:MAG TPA: homoserine dehydrogenase, partial [Planctomycetota bacterium]|nr:homoserine dehydrogenase [Planctomycetota bacterium]